MELNYLQSVTRQFEYYKTLGEKTFGQLTDAQLSRQVSSESNSIATIVKHLHGNMLSRWTYLLTSDGEKEWRKRDAEFEQADLEKEKLVALWQEGWQCLFTALASLKEDDLHKIIYIRNQGHTVMEAINRQLAHYPYHVGQIVFIGKMLVNDEWQSLSIPKNRSQEYNSEKFSKEKHREQFTDEFLKKKS